MKKTLLIFGLLFLTGCSQPQFGVVSEAKEWVRVPSKNLVRSLSTTIQTLISGYGSAATTTNAALEVQGDIHATGSIEFLNELKPDGLTCSNGQILQKTATNDWDCVTFSSSSGTSGAWEFFFPNAIHPTSTSSGIYVHASSTFDNTLRVNGNVLLPSLSSGTLFNNSGTVISTSTLSVANGGTGAATFSSNGFILGNGTSPLQSSQLTGLVYGNGSSAPTATTTLSVVAGGTGAASFTATDILLGNGTSPFTSTSTLSVIKGGIGTTSLTTNGFLFGGGTSPITSSQFTGFVYGNGATAATASTTISVVAGGTGATTHTSGSLLVGNGTSPLTSTSTVSVVKGGTGAVSFSVNDVVIGGGTSPLTTTSTLSIVKGGTGASTLTANGICIANGTSPLSSTVLTNGQFLIGSTGAAPVASTLTESTSIDVANGAGSASIAWDSTEVEATTWGAGGNASNIWTFNLSGTDPTMTAQSNGFTFAGQTTSTISIWSGTGGTANRLDLLGGDIFAQDDLQAADEIFSNRASSTSATSTAYTYIGPDGTEPKGWDFSGGDLFVADDTYLGDRATTTGVHVFGSDGAGDAAMQFYDTNVKSYILGNDDSTNLFNLSNGATLGTNSLFTMDSAGNATTTRSMVIGTTNPTGQGLSSGDLFLGGSATTTKSISVAGDVIFSNLPASGVGDTYICKSANNSLHTGATCAASAREYKTNTADLTHGLDWLLQMTPVTFDWKQDGSHDIGLIADDLQKIDERLAIMQDGKVFSFKDRAVLAVAIKSIQEQQKQIENLKNGGHNFNWSWLGLLGFLGLIPLLKRK